MAKKKQMKINTDSGKLKIGNNWNANTIIALSQNNPLKAIAEFVENSIDAKAKNITIIRGKLKGETYLKFIDDGEGIDDFIYASKSKTRKLRYIAKLFTKELVLSNFPEASKKRSSGKNDRAADVYGGKSAGLVQSKMNSHGLFNLS